MSNKVLYYGECLFWELRPDFAVARYAIDLKAELCRHLGDFRAQARATYSALKAQVEAGGGTISSIVKLTTYLVGTRHRNGLASIREEFFGTRGPASTLIGLTALAESDC
jgi:enamine deaminase RidA (YjgF/YER057c/UK114 family)